MLAVKLDPPEFAQHRHFAYSRSMLLDNKQAEEIATHVPHTCQLDYGQEAAPLNR